MNAAQVVYEPLMYLNCIYELFLLNYFLKSVFPIYEDSKFLKILKIVGGATAIYIVNSFKMPHVNLIFVPLILLVFIWFMFHIELKYNILYVIFYYVIIAVSEFVFQYIYTLLGIDVTSAGFGRILLLIIQDVFVFMLIEFIKKQHQRNYKDDSYRYLKNLFILPIATIVLLNGFFISIYPLNYLLIFCGGILLIVCTVIEFSVIEKLLEAVNTARDTEMLSLKTQLERNHYQRLEEVNQDYAKYLHEMKRMIRIIDELAYTEDNSGAKKLAAEISQRGFYIRRKIYIGDEITNAIFIEREKSAFDMGIDYQVNIQVGTDITFISDMDKITMFGNLLDNAIEAAGKNGYVYASLYRGNDALVIFRVENNFNVEPYKCGKEYLTIKHEKKRHGFGIKNVEELAHKYGGTLYLDDKDSKFTAVLVLSKVQKMES